jgi:multiple sugar transport system permease protein
MSKKKDSLSLSKVEAKWGLILALPAILGFILWTAGPMIASLVLSFTSWDAVTSPKFIGLSNYRKLLIEDPLFKKSLGVTLYYSVGSVPLVLAIAFIVALLLNQKVRGLAFFRTAFYLPSIVPAVASAMIWIWLFNPDFGLLNQFLGIFNLPKLQWIYSETQVIPSLILMSIWGMGGSMIIFLAGLQGVPEQLYEAVEVDGGNWWHKFRYITIPMMTPIIFFNLIMGIIGTLQTFNQAYVMTSGGPNYASLFYVYYLYLNAFNYGAMGYSCALAWILFLIVLGLTLIVLRSSSYWVYYEMGKGR